MEKWEYMTMFLCADIENQGAREFIQKTWPDWKNPSKYAPETMMLELNAWGEKGWELLHIEPVIGDKDSSIIFPGTYKYLTNCYFCVFKRRKQ